MAKTKKSVRAAKPTKGGGYHHGDLRKTLIGVAVQMLRTKAPEDLSLREVARAAGVSQAAPYRHFKDKNALLAAISQQGFELKSSYMRQAIADAEDELAMFYGIGLAYFKMGLKHPQHFNLMLTSVVVPSKDYPELEAAAATSFAILSQAIERCQKAGVVGPGNPFHKSLHCWCVVNGFTALYAEGRLDWLGVTKENAESALKSLISQYLLGAKTDLANSSFGFAPFQTPESCENLAKLTSIGQMITEAKPS